VETGADLVAEAHHRVANSLSLLVALVRMQAQALAKASQPLSGAQVRLLLEGIAARIATISQLHRLLARVPGDGAMVNFGDHLAEVCRTLVSIVSTPQQPVHLELAAQNCRVAARQVQPLTLILCEIAVNALKHAHPEGGPLQLTVNCHHDAQGAFVMEARDDGVGLPAQFDAARDGGLGFRVIRSLSTQIGADLKIGNCAPGVCFRLQLPPAQGCEQSA
jgi:two-component sensor histidine kinase